MIDYSRMSFKIPGDVMVDYSIHFLSEIKGIIACEMLGVYKRLNHKGRFNDFIILSLGGMPDRATRFLWVKINEMKDNNKTEDECRPVLAPRLTPAERRKSFKRVSAQEGSGPGERAETGAKNGSGDGRAARPGSYLITDGGYGGGVILRNLKWGPIDSSNSMTDMELQSHYPKLEWLGKYWSYKYGLNKLNFLGLKASQVQENFRKDD